MVILEKKRIICLTACIAIALIACMYKNNTVETVSLPVSNKVIVIDAGHGAPDEGDYLLH